MKPLALAAVLLASCSPPAGKTFEQAVLESHRCTTETNWVEHGSTPGSWIAMCGDENGNPLHRP